MKYAFLQPMIVCEIGTLSRLFQVARLLNEQLSIPSFHQ